MRSWRKAAVVAALIIAGAVAAPAGASEIVDRPKWMGLDKIAPADKQAAREVGPMEQLLNPKVAKDDDIVPGILLLGPANRNSLIVRFTPAQPCGNFVYYLFSPRVDEKRTKQMEVCGDDLHLVRRAGQRWPDLLIATSGGPMRLTLTEQGWAKVGN